MSAASEAATYADEAGSGSELAAAFKAVRARLLLVLLLFALAGLAWWSTSHRMVGMNAGPGTDLGGLGWFVGVWVVMMAAMMFPSVSPTVALYARMTKKHGVGRPLLFTGAYLVVWGAAGVFAFGLFAAGKELLGSQLAWDSGGRWFAGAVIAIAAVYELTPLKDACLGKCRSPLGFLIGRWRDGARGAVEMGAAHAAWCVGCCWALMAALFALGVMSITWMVFVGALIALEKTFPWQRAVTWGTAMILGVLAVLVVAIPHDVPGLVVPGSAEAHGAMKSMHMNAAPMKPMHKKSTHRSMQMH